MKSLFEEMGGTYRQVGVTSSLTLFCRMTTNIR